MDFLTDWGVIIALVCAGCAVIYGVLTSRWLLALSPGNEEMQAISRAVQEGATAYLRRQYTIIAGVAVVLAIVLGVALEAQDREGILTAIGFLIGGTLLRLGRLHRHERVGTRQRPRGRVGALGRVAGPRGRLQGRRGHRPARGGPGAAGRRRLLRDPDPGRHRRARRDRRPRRARLRRLADLGLRPSGRRHLHQGRRRRRRPRRQDRGRHPRGRPAQPGRDRRQRGRQRRRLRRHGGRPVRDLCRHRGRGDAARRADLPGDRDRRGLPARHRRRLAARLDHRHVRRAQRGRQRGARALPGPDRLGRPGGGGLPADHAGDVGRPALQGRRLVAAARRRLGGAQRDRAVPLHADRHRHHGGAVRHHRLLHVDPLPARCAPPRGRRRPATRPTSSRGSRRASSPPPRRRSCWRWASWPPTSWPASTASAWR